MAAEKGGWDRKNWDQIARELSSGEDSDAGDSLNVMSVVRNAHRVAELMHGALPGLDATQMRTPPRGMNGVDFIRDGLAAATAEGARRSGARRASPPSASSGRAPPPPAPADPTPSDGRSSTSTA